MDQTVALTRSSYKSATSKGLACINEAELHHSNEDRERREGFASTRPGKLLTKLLTPQYWFHTQNSF